MAAYRETVAALAPATWPVAALGAIIKLYQLSMSPLLGQHCRFAPSCSAYALVALDKRGIWQGVWLIVRRLARCHPWHPGGWDPVP